MRLIGQTGIWIALLMSAWSFTVYVVGIQRGRVDLIRSADRAIHVVCASTIIATVVLVAGLLRHDFSMRYVATYSSLNLPAPYLVAALWSGQRGSLLLAATILSTLACLIVLRGRSERDRVHAALLSILLVVIIAILGIALDPLGGLAWVPVDGIGMLPALQTPGAVLFPPLLITAYATSAVAGTRALSLIIGKGAGVEDVASVVRWTVIAWVFNTVGLVAALWWAYREPSHSLRWLSYAFETGAVLPWFALTAFLGTIRLRRRKGTLAGWFVSLPVGAMLLTGPAASLTTAAVAQSAGAAARSGLFILGGAVVAIAIGIAAVATSRRLPSVVMPRTGARTYGTLVLIAGLMMAAGAIGGRFMRTVSVASVSVTEPAEVVDAFGARWAFTSQGLSRYGELNRQVDAIGIDVQRNEETVALVTTELRQYVDAIGEPVFPPARVAGVRSTLREDVQVVIREFSGTDSAVIGITITPLLMWFWIGGLLVALGGLLACWPADVRSAGT